MASTAHITIHADGNTPRITGADIVIAPQQAAPVEPKPADNGTARISGADIAISPLPVAPAGSYAALSALLDACGPNKNHRAITLIGACIADGFDTKGAIISAGIRMGLNNRHVARILDEGTGRNPELRRWRRDPDGTYSLLN
jgi:hypothetical protein